MSELYLTTHLAMNAIPIDTMIVRVEEQKCSWIHPSCSPPRERGQERCCMRASRLLLLEIYLTEYHLSNNSSICTMADDGFMFESFADKAVRAMANSRIALEQHDQVKPGAPVL